MIPKHCCRVLGLFDVRFGLNVGNMMRYGVRRGDVWNLQPRNALSGVAHALGYSGEDVKIVKSKR